MWLLPLELRLMVGRVAIAQDISRYRGPERTHSQADASSLPGFWDACSLPGRPKPMQGSLSQQLPHLCEPVRGLLTVADSHVAALRPAYLSRYCSSCQT